MSDWNWYGDDEKSNTVIPRLDAVAVYSNAADDVVIRQQGSMGEDDVVIIIHRSHAKLIADAILMEVQGT